MTHGSDWDDDYCWCDFGETCDSCRLTPAQQAAWDQASRETTSFGNFLRKKLPWIKNYLSSYGRSNINMGLVWRVELGGTYKPEVVTSMLKEKEYLGTPITFIAKVKYPAYKYRDARWETSIITADIIEGTNQGLLCTCGQGRHTKIWKDSYKCSACPNTIKI